MNRNEYLDISLAFICYRDWTGISQTELGEKLGLSRQSISNIERGKHLPRLGTFLMFEELWLEQKLTKQLHNSNANKTLNSLSRSQ